MSKKTGKSAVGEHWVYLTAMDLSWNQSGNKGEKIKCTCYISDHVEVGHQTKKLRELGSRKKIGGRINLWIA